MSNKSRTENPASEPEGVLDGAASSLPARSRAMEFQQRVAAVGFDWPQVSQVLEKIELTAAAVELGK